MTKYEPEQKTSPIPSPKNNCKYSCPDILSSLISHLKQKNRPILSDKTAHITNPKTNTMKNKKLYLYNSPKILYHEQITRFYNKPQSRYRVIDQIGQYRSRQISPGPTYEQEPSL